MKKQCAVVVLVDMTNGFLHAEALNGKLDEGWTVASTETSTPGSILVILEKDEP